MVAEFPQKNGRQSYNTQLNSWSVSKVTLVLRLGCEYLARCMTSQFSSDDNDIRQVFFQVKVAGLGHTVWAKTCFTALMKGRVNMGNCKDMKSITTHEETLEVYLHMLNVSSSSLRCRFPMVQS